MSEGHFLCEHRFDCIGVSPADRFHCIEVSLADRFHCIEVSPEDIIS